MLSLREKRERVEKIGRIKSLITDIKDFPKKGVMFKDISPLLADSEAFRDTILYLQNMCEVPDFYLCMDARGFLFGAPMAYNNDKSGLLMCRKKGKLPGECSSKSYKLEYGESALEIRKGIAPRGSKIVIVDDLCATGGTLLAAIDLCKDLGLEVLCCLCVIDLKDLGGSSKLREKGIKFESLITY